MDHPLGRMPYPPYAHIAVTVRTAQRVSPGALLIALAVGQRGDDFDRAFDEALDLGQGHCQVNEKSLSDAFPLRKAEG
jgi:hypothetical protein